MLTVAVAGAAGLLGTELLRVLEDQAFPVEVLRPLADTAEIEASGTEDPGEPGTPTRSVEFHEEELPLIEASAAAFEGCDIAFLAGTPEQAGRLAKLAFLRVPCTIDLSGRFADDPDVPLVLTEIDARALEALPARSLLAVPDAATAMVLLALAPLHRAAGVKSVVVSTYESASGAGRPGMDELGRQIKELFNYRSADAEVFPRSLAFNCLPQIDAFEGNGYTRSEMSMARGVARVIGAAIPVTATRVWVPVFSGHSASIVLETERPMTAADARKILEDAPGVEIVDDPAEGGYPVNGDAVGSDTMLVGRIRAAGPNRLAMWIAADNLRRGAALAAVRAAAAVLAKRQAVS